MSQPAGAAFKVGYEFFLERQNMLKRSPTHSLAAS